MSMIYIVEDDRNISEIESFSLKNSGYETAVFETAKDFYGALAGQIPSLVLLDVMLPDEDGLHIVQKLRKDPLTQEIPVIMVTAKSTEMDKVKGLDLGADDYLSKPFGVMELISRVKALLRRSGERKEERKLVIGRVLLDEERHAVYVDDKQCELTHKEYELLKLLMLRAGIVTGRMDILDQVWGTDFQGESRTLDMHIKTLRRKLGEAGSMIKTVRNVGYILDTMTE
ncbi:MAG: response regulator transcription factor [Lachnospiraceae bacterium]|jgi:two-component system alkaline phosphatase synthesis response regulator PhoP|nr:response regulator transcription factor [Lachnospiraceae bacterium]